MKLSGRLCHTKYRRGRENTTKLVGRTETQVQHAVRDEGDREESAQKGRTPFEMSETN